jgi:hypothetical protein
MPGGGGDPAAQAVAIQMKDFHPGRSPKPGAHARHLAGLARSQSLPHRDYCASLSSARRQRSPIERQWGPTLAPLFPPDPPRKPRLLRSFKRVANTPIGMPARGRRS